MPENTNINFVPVEDEKGSLGRADKRWDGVYTTKLYADEVIADGSPLLDTRIQLEELQTKIIQLEERVEARVAERLSSGPKPSPASPAGSSCTVESFFHV